MSGLKGGCSCPPRGCWTRGGATCQPREFAEPLLRDLAKELDESRRLGRLEPPDVRYVAHVPAPHVVSISGSGEDLLAALRAPAGRDR